jgi:hypothetical protein
MIRTPQLRGSFLITGFADGFYAVLVVEYGILKKLIVNLRVEKITDNIKPKGF